MKQMLQRGFAIANGERITRVVAENSLWQIYLTNCEGYVLAVTPELYNCWVDNYALPQDLFIAEKEHNCYIFSCSKNYLISSLGKGPYHENSSQIEAFSLAFNTAITLFPNIDLTDAIYIEKYSLILPTKAPNANADNALAYGKWLTCGVNISITEFDRISTIMSWITKETLIRASNTAGFAVSDDQNLTTTQETCNEIKHNNTSKLLQPTRMGKFTLVGRPELERFFNENIIDIVMRQEEYQRMGISFPGATILYGPPGCGKTYAVDRLAEYLGWPRFDINANAIGSSYIHETSKKISAMFKSAIDAAPSILIIDEMEAFLSDRSLSSAGNTYHLEEVAEFLRWIPEAISSGVLVFAMTNMIDKIDPAILRRGRFDHLVEVKLPAKEEIAALLSSKFQELPVESSIDIESIAASLDGHPMSDITFVLREAGKWAVKQNLVEMNQSCFDSAIAQLPKSEVQKRIGF